MSSQQGKIRSVTDLVAVASSLRASAQLPLWWRGHAVEAWQLAPSIYRTSTEHQREQNMLAQFVSGAQTRHPSLPPRDDLPAWLFLAQHHGLPTRLLDWTEAPLTALYFALAREHLEMDGSLWALNPHRLNRAMIQRDELIVPRKAPAIDLVRAAFTGDASDPAAVATFPYEVDDRMLLQQSRFTLHGSATPLEALSLDSDVLGTYIVLARDKANLLRELEALAIRRSSLFPGLDSLALDLRERVYRARA